MRPIGHTTDRTVLVFAGGFDYGELVKATEKASRDASNLTKPEPARPHGSPEAGLYRFGGVHL